MNRKPNSKSGLSFNVGPAQTTKVLESVNTTPTSENKLIEGDISFGSPIFSQFSQEEYETFDVMWNWGSTQIKPRSRKHKRLDFAQPPKPPIKRHPSNNQMADLIKLQDDLQSLTYDLINSKSNNKQDVPSITNKSANDLENVFDDSMEDELLICSQEVETRINIMHPIESIKVEKFSTKQNDCSLVTLPAMTDFTFPFSNTKKTDLTSRLPHLDDELAYNSFNQHFQEMQDQDLTLYGINKELDSTQVKPISRATPGGTISLDEEIERKRREAVKKLESKKSRLQISTEGESPIKCSPEEIEQKRLQALAKLQEKKKLELIQRNRLEALKRLELNRKKRPTMFTCTSKLNKVTR